MITIRTLTAGVDTRWDDKADEHIPTVVLKFGDAEVIRWDVPEHQRYSLTADYDNDPAEALDEFVASKLAALFGGTR